MYVQKTLTKIFKNAKVEKNLEFEDILTDESKLKDNELKIFLLGIKLIFNICSDSSEITNQFIEKAISTILNWVKTTEESILNKQDSLFRGN